jgi:8-oxo-dGTP pyrophosphatase MutT (NUDIX family)
MAESAEGVDEVAQDASAFHLLLACPSGVPASLLEVDFSRVYDRQPHPDPILENSIEKTWEERLAAQPCLYNGTKFRYGGYKILTGSEEMAWATSACLHLGLTDYKTFMGTNLCPKWERFLAPDVEDAIKCRHTASPLGNGAVVKTIDDKIIVLQRGSNVGEFPHTLVFPGGHSEPEEIGIKGHLQGNSEAEKKALETKIAQEMFEGITREVVEETGIPASFLNEPLFIGISRRVVNMRPTAFFFIKCALSSSQVLEYYQRAADRFESTNLLLVPQDELLQAAKKMPGCHHGGAALYDLARKILD